MFFRKAAKIQELEQSLYEARVQLYTVFATLREQHQKEINELRADHEKTFVQLQEENERLEARLHQAHAEQKNWGAYE